jgi:hypothetical protein
MVIGNCILMTDHCRTISLVSKDEIAVGEGQLVRGALIAFAGWIGDMYLCSSLTLAHDFTAMASGAIADG